MWSESRHEDCPTLSVFWIISAILAYWIVRLFCVGEEQHMYVLDAVYNCVHVECVCKLLCVSTCGGQMKTYWVSCSIALFPRERVSLSLKFSVFVLDQGVPAMLSLLRSSQCFPTLELQLGSATLSCLHGCWGFEIRNSRLYTNTLTH